MTGDLYIKRSDAVAVRRFGDELMIMAAQDSSLFSLNETAALLWNAADGVTPLMEIVTRDICPEFDVDATTAFNDAHEVALQLAERGILQLAAYPISSTATQACA